MNILHILVFENIVFTFAAVKTFLNSKHQKNEIRSTKKPN
jgi:hypothetical protein